ncbi:hypothetical protein D3C78_1772460 [compost metagenome]
MTESKLIQWVLFNAGFVGSFLDLKQHITPEQQAEFKELYGQDLAFTTTNPLPYMTEFMDISATQASPQEADKPDYMVNIADARGEQEEFDVDF